MMLRRLLGQRTRSPENLYSAIVTAARQPRFYAEWGVPDTLDGRFDMIVLHQFLVLDRLRNEPGQEDLSQALTDTFFDDMDRSLREMGVGDLSVGKKVRKMAEAYHGRLAAYGKALPQQGDALELALARNVFGRAETVSGAEQLARWTRTAQAALASQTLNKIVTGAIQWP